ncbi:uncharacterized protein SPSC_00004 [Sporisorium scitamineum]|uniref:Transmembrane protein n=1 Tax=Sporisorium scitamineum TaxID=49012 RepID=A0A140KLV3_9BASI|nr:uncharacterized protein SPSC_00004 [Sporisorium scitamineum]
MVSPPLWSRSNGSITPRGRPVWASPAKFLNNVSTAKVPASLNKARKRKWQNRLAAAAAVVADSSGDSLLDSPLAMCNGNSRQAHSLPPLPPLKPTETVNDPLDQEWTDDERHDDSGEVNPSWQAESEAEAETQHETQAKPSTCWSILNFIDWDHHFIKVVNFYNAYGFIVLLCALLLTTACFKFSYRLIKPCLVYIKDTLIAESVENALAVQAAIKGALRSVRFLLGWAIWWCSETILVPIVSALKGTKVAQRHIELLLTNTSVSGVAGAFGNCAVATTTAAAVATMTVATATATAAAASATTTTNAATGMDLDRDTQIVSLWTQPEMEIRVQTCLKVYRILLEETASLAPQPASILEQLKQAPPSFANLYKVHPECFQSPLKFILTGTNPAHPFDSFLANQYGFASASASASAHAARKEAGVRSFGARARDAKQGQVDKEEATSPT